MNLLLLVATTIGSIGASDSSSCSADCSPNGKCVMGECLCYYGFAGADCSFPYEQCPDGIMTCFDGAKCERIVDRSSESYSEGRSSYKCDCSRIPNASPFQIAQCENPQSEYCEEGQSTSEYAFCTNGGKCVAIIRKGEDHAGCKCPPDFEGRHCQYRKGEAPDAEMQLAFVEDGSHLSGIFLFFIIVVVAAVVGMIGHFMYKNFVDDTDPEEERVQKTLADLRMQPSFDEQEEEEQPITKGEIA